MGSKLSWVEVESSEADESLEEDVRLMKVALRTVQGCLGWFVLNHYDVMLLHAPPCGVYA